MENRYKVMTFNELVELGNDKREIIGRLLNLVEITVDGISDGSVGDIDQWLGIIEKVPESCSILVDTKDQEIIGHWFFTALDKPLYNEALSGTLMESKMTDKNVNLLKEKGNFYGYFNQIEILEEHRNPEAFLMLILSFFQTLENLALRGFCFFDWITLAASKDGEKMATSLGLRYEKDHIIDGKIFIGNIFTMVNLKILNRFPQLIEKYNEAYDLLSKNAKNGK